jgi:hypothetical protein
MGGAVMRGKSAKPGDTRIAPNGYHYTKTKRDGWRLTHHIIAEKTLGRPLKDGERVVFIDKDRSNLEPNNIEVKITGTSSLRRRKAQLEARIQELQAQLHDVESEIKRDPKLT